MRNVVLAILVVLALFLSGILVLVFLWWLLSKGQKEAPAALEISEAAQVEVEDLAPSGADEAVVSPGAEAGVDETAEAGVEPTPEQSEPDDLTRIEGIGPKIASVLQAAGVLTFAQLAETDVTRLEEILEAESPRLRRLSDPSTWPEQAELAATGEWEALQALQGTLKRGRRSG
jgi:predicted flap endonuclease-1-like 5' DNA nuclease